MKNKQVIRLTESELQKIVDTSVKKVLKEDSQLQLDFENGANEDIFVALPYCVLDFSKLNLGSQICASYGKGLYGFKNLYDIVKNCYHSKNPQIIYKGKNIGSEAKDFGKGGPNMKSIANYNGNRRFNNSEGDIIIINPTDFIPKSISTDNGRTWFKCL